MPRFVLKALPSLERPLPNDLNGNGLELGDEERKFVLVTVPEGIHDADIDDILEAARDAANLPVLVVTKGITVEVMEIKQVKSAWERL